MDLSDEQHRAIASIDAWYYGRRSKQVFSVAGYAGTGKTTLIKHAVTSLGLEAVDYAAFTGKAALVMRSKGLDDARTIHSLLYRPVEVEEFDLIEDAIVRKVKWAKKGGLFGLHTSPLIVLDEVSMVDKNLARDLLAYDRPILVVGDPGQLPPIRGEGAFHVDRPDVKLTRIQRQAEHNSIIDVSMKARHGEDIAFGKHGDQVTKIPRSRLSVQPDAASRPDHLRVSTNARRDQLAVA